MPKSCFAYLCLFIFFFLAKLTYLNADFLVRLCLFLFLSVKRISVETHLWENDSCSFFSLILSFTVYVWKPARDAGPKPRKRKQYDGGGSHVFELWLWLRREENVYRNCLNLNERWFSCS